MMLNIPMKFFRLGFLKFNELFIPKTGRTKKSNFPVDCLEHGVAGEATQHQITKDSNHLLVTQMFYYLHGDMNLAI